MFHTKLSRIGIILIALLSFLALSSPARAASKKLDGRWQLTISIPEAPNSGSTRTFTITLDASPRGESLHGRLTATDGMGATVGGVWRQVGKRVSIAFDLPCSAGSQCGSLILLGRIKNKVRIKGGEVIVMWDTPNPGNHAQFDTSNGSFTGDRLE